MKSLVSAATVLLVVCALPANATAQATADKDSGPTTSVTALMVEVTISRYQGEKRISSLPYTLSVVPNRSNRPATLRIGGEIPVATTVASKDPAAADPKPVSYSYRPIGTNIDVIVDSMAEDRYAVQIVVEETSIYPPSDSSKGPFLVSNAPAFRSFRSSNLLSLRDGQSLEYTAATDRITGEVAHVSVKLTVVK